MNQHPAYLGDGVYASFDGFQIWLAADRDGQRHEIALESSTFLALLTYAHERFGIRISVEPLNAVATASVAPLDAMVQGVPVPKAPTCGSDLP